MRLAALWGSQSWLQAAFRENAQKSTGPKTEEGKRRSSPNGIRHGLTGQVIVLPTEDLAEFERFANTFWHYYKPQGALESQLVQMVSDIAWRINHASAVEKVRISLTIDDERESVDTDCTPLHDVQAERRVLEAEEMEKAAALFEMEEETAAAKSLVKEAQWRPEPRPAATLKLYGPFGFFFRAKVRNLRTRPPKLSCGSDVGGRRICRPLLRIHRHE